MALQDADEAVLATLEIDVLRPEVVTAALQEAIVRLARPAGDVDADRERLRQTVTRLQAELTRLTEALGSGGHLPSIVAAITEKEAQRSRAQQELAALDQVEQARGFDLPRVEQDLRAKLADWRGLLARNVAQARQVLRSLVPERLTFTPKNERGERFYVFEGMAVLDRFLAGIALPKAVVAPTGFAPFGNASNPRNREGCVTWADPSLPRAPPPTSELAPTGRTLRFSSPRSGNTPLDAVGSW